MKRNRGYLVSIVIVVLLAAAGVAGLTVLEARPKLGLDLKGGLSVVLQARGEDVQADTLERTVQIIRDRVDSIGAAEPEVSVAGSENILVQLPDVEDRDRALQIIGKTAQLRFRPVLDQRTPQEGEAEGWELSEFDLPDREAIYPNAEGDRWFRLAPAAVQGDQVQDAFASFDQATNQWTVQLQFSREGSDAFAQVTQQLASPTGTGAGLLAIVLDGVVESAPQVQQPITNGQAQISGTFREPEARDLALVLKTGALPIELEPIQVESVSATLGLASLRAGLWAGAIGIVLVAFWMLAFYRLLGVITILGMGLFGALILGLVGLLGVTYGFTLTLAGVAGLIVSVGIAADSYIIYFERVKDELKEGKTFRSAVDRGFQSSFRTNLAANSVAFAAAIILYLLAVGPVRGFALTLGISVVLDILILYFYTHPAVALISRNRRLAGLRAVGMREVVQPA